MARVDRCSGTLQIRFGADTNAGYLDDRPGPAPRPPAKECRTRAPRPFLRGRSYVFGSVNARRCDVSARLARVGIIRSCEAVQHGPPDQRKTSDTRSAADPGGTARSHRTSARHTVLRLSVQTPRTAAALRLRPRRAHSSRSMPALGLYSAFAGKGEGSSKSTGSSPMASRPK